MRANTEYNIKMKNKSRSFTRINYSIGVIVILLFSNCKEKEKDPLVLGKTHQGGIIIFLEDNGEHGIIAATTDQHTNIQWCLGSCISTNASATAPGTGKANTALIVATQKTGNYAAFICDQLVHNGFDDWHLPSKDELNALFIQKEAGRIGNFLAEEYWSSTENSADRAWNQHLGNGTIHFEIKENAGCIRAVRSF
jgi:hypothetical protein